VNVQATEHHRHKKHISTSQIMCTNRIITTGHPKIHNSVLSAAIIWPCGPYYLENNEGAAVTLTPERHVEMLHNFCEPELRRREIDFSSGWF
jgi:hypothetical protein